MRAIILVFQEMGQLKDKLSIQIQLKYQIYKTVMILGSSSAPAPLQSSVIKDVEYQLSRYFINYARDQLVHKQIALMMETNLLLQTLGTRLSARNNHNYEKDFCNVVTSQTLDTLNDEDDVPRTKHRLFTPPPKLLNSESNWSSALEEIRDTCSPKTVSTVTTIIENYNKLKANANEMKSRLNNSSNGIVRSRPDTDRSSNDQSQILIAKLIKIQKENTLLNEKIADLEGRMVKSSSSPIEYATDDIKIYFDEQQQRLEKYENRIKGLEDKIITSLHEGIINEGCNRCCVMVKKIKDSLINYRECLTLEIQTYRTLWQKLHVVHDNFQAEKSQKHKIQQ